MIHRHSLMLAAALLAAATSGCTSLGTTVRSQSPNFSPTYANPYHHPSHAQPVGALSDHMQDVYHEHHNTDTTYYHGGSVMANPDGAYCPPQGGYQGGYCPPGTSGGPHDFGIHHGYSYSYNRPNDLVYPTSQVGGMIVYPYYTHRGPSDFFTK